MLLYWCHGRPTRDFVSKIVHQTERHTHIDLLWLFNRCAQTANIHTPSNTEWLLRLSILFSISNINTIWTFSKFSGHRLTQIMFILVRLLYSSLAMFPFGYEKDNHRTSEACEKFQYLSIWSGMNFHIYFSSPLWLLLLLLLFVLLYRHVPHREMPIRCMSVHNF